MKYALGKDLRKSCVYCLRTCFSMLNEVMSVPYDVFCEIMIDESCRRNLLKVYLRHGAFHRRKKRFLKTR